MDKMVQTNTDLWRALAESKKPIFVYGTGNGADKIFKIFEHYGIAAAGVFASDGFVRCRTFRGFPVRSYSDVVGEYGNEIAVVAAFGSARPEVLEFMARLDSAHDFYIPEVPLFCDDLCGELFCAEYYACNLEWIREARDMFSDSASKSLYSDMIEHRLCGRLAPLLRRTEEFADSVKTLIDCENIKYAIDGGAFRGDTVRIFRDTFPNIERLAAVEPDPSSGKKLSALAAEPGFDFVVPIAAMIDSACGEGILMSAGSRGSALSGGDDAAGLSASPNAVGEKEKRGKAIHVSSRTVDEIVQTYLDGRIDFLKLDVEGAESAALLGAENTLRSRPSLAVSLYHRTGDFFRLPLLLRKYYPDGKFYLRRPRCVPAWDLTLFVTN